MLEQLAAAPGEDARDALDPFVLPAPTAARFWLLVVTTLAAAVVPTYLNLDTFHRRGQPVAPLSLTESLAFMAAVAAGALVIWWVHPAAKIRRRGLRPLPAGELTELRTCLRELCELAGLRRHPTFLWNPLQVVPAAVAFGRVRTLYVGLSGGLVVEFSRDRAAFRAVLLHELAHVRNGDVPITYFAMAIWWSFVALVLVPFVPVQLLSAFELSARLGTDPLHWVITWSWRVLALTVLVYLSRNSVLRAREVYADVRAAAWDGPAGALRRVLDRLPGREPWWRRALLVHPDPARRRRWLDQTDPLFGIGFWEALAVGCALALANADLVAGLVTRLTDIAQLLLASLLVAFAVSLVAAGVVRLGLWRAAFAAAARGRRPRGTTVAGIGLGLGLALGPNLSLNALPIELTGTGRYLGLRPALPDLVVDAMVVGGAVLIVRWTSGSATAWLRWRLAGPRPRLAGVAGQLATSIVLGSFVVLGTYVTLLLGTGRENVGDLPSVLGLSLLSPPGVLVVVSLWAFPLTAELMASRVTRGLDGAPGRLPGPRREVLTGLAGGVVFWPVYLLAVLLLHLPPPLSGLAFAFCVMQAVVGATAAWRARRPAVPRGLLAAFVAACVTLPVALWLTPPAQVSPLAAFVAAGLWLDMGTAAALPAVVLGAAARARAIPLSR